MNATIYTDPGCPFGFNAQRQELQLLWHYGEGLAVTRRMIVLVEKTSSFEELGLSRKMVAANMKRLRALYGMPMLTDPPERLASTFDACRALSAREFMPASTRISSSARCAVEGSRTVKRSTTAARSERPDAMPGSRAMRWTHGWPTRTCAPSCARTWWRLGRRFPRRSRLPTGSPRATGSCVTPPPRPCSSAVIAES